MRRFLKIAWLMMRGGPLVGLMLVVLAVGGVWFFIHRDEQIYTRVTTPEQRAAHEAMAKRLEVAPVGTIIEFNSGELASLVRNGTGDMRGYINVSYVGNRFPRLRIPQWVARDVRRLIPPSDPDWFECVKRFLDEQKRKGTK